MTSVEIKQNSESGNDRGSLLQFGYGRFFKDVTVEFRFQR